MITDEKEAETLVDTYLKEYLVEVLLISNTYPEASTIVNKMVGLTKLSTEASLRTTGGNIVNLIGRLTTEKALEPGLSLALAKLTETTVHLLVIKLGFALHEASSKTRVLH